MISVVDGFILLKSSLLVLLMIAIYGINYGAFAGVRKFLLLIRLNSRKILVALKK